MTSTTTTKGREHNVSKPGKTVLMVEIGLADAKTALKRPSGAPKTSQRQPQNAPKAIFGSKKRANEAQESSKTNLEALFGRSRGPKELPRDPQESPKSSQKEAERAPKRFQKPSLDRKWRFLKNQRFRSKDGFEIVLGLSRALFRSSWKALGRSEGPLDRPKRASRFILELSWAWFARLLLPKITLRGPWGRRCRFLSPLGTSCGRF